MLVRSGAVDVVVIDSVAALTPKAEIEGEMGEPQMGLQARLMSQALRKLTANIKRSNTLVIFINQIRMKIGVMFGNPGNHHRRQRAEVLRLGAPRHPPHRLDQEGRGGHRQRDAREGRQEQGGAAVPGGRFRHPVRRRHLARRRDHRAGRAAQAHREVGRLVQLQQASASARARTTRASSSRSIARWPTRSNPRSGQTPASTRLLLRLRWQRKSNAVK